MQDGDISAMDKGQYGEIPMDKLYPALFECFAVILCGYLAGRLNILPQSEAKGLNTFVGTFSLPCLIFVSLAQLELTSVNWMFLLSILVAKAIVFFAVIIVTLLVSRPLNPGRAGLFGIFCTQSNDFAIGFPIVEALYSESHPTYKAYLYLLAPISLVILNPIGFTLMEIGKRGLSGGDVAAEVRANSGGRDKLILVGTIAKNIVLNPVVLMTALGIIGNLVFKHNLPVSIAGILNVFGSAFSASALFLLGVRMVGKVQHLQGSVLIVPALLIASKLLVLPLVTREIVSLLHAGGNASETQDLSTYGFLYGTFPSAPGVFVFATQYSLEVDLIASAMVACTFLSAPLMFVSAKMIAMSSMLPLQYVEELNEFAVDISYATIFACIWLVITFIVRGKIIRIPHRVTVSLILSQVIAAVGVVLWKVLGREEMWRVHLQFAVYAFGDWSTRIWTGIVALTLLLLQTRSLCLVMRLLPIFMVVGWGVPFLIVLILILVVNAEKAAMNPPDFSSTYGDYQVATSLFILLVSFLVSVSCLVIRERYRRRFARYLLLVQDMGDNDTSDLSFNANVARGQTTFTDPTGRSTQASIDHSAVSTANGSHGDGQGAGSINQIVDIEDIRPVRSQESRESERIPPCPGDLCPARFECSSARRAICHSLVEEYHTALADEEDQQTQRHQVALLILCCSMFLGMAVCTWRLLMDNLTGIYVELAFLDTALNQGQGLVMLAVFGLHSKAMFGPFFNWWRNFWPGDVPPDEVAWEKLEFETRHVCEQFTTNHIAACRVAISRSRRWRFRLYKESFRGNELVDWIVDNGVAGTREQAVVYCRHLEMGNIIRHMGDSQHFQDAPLLFNFSPPLAVTPHGTETPAP